MLFYAWDFIHDDFKENGFFAATTTQIKTKYNDIAKRPILENQPVLKLNEKNQSIHKVPLKETLCMSRRGHNECNVIHGTRWARMMSCVMALR